MASRKGNVSRRPGWIPRWLGFWFSAPILAASVIAEGIASFFHFLLFPLHAARVKSRVRSVMSTSRGTGARMLLVAAFFALAGCSSRQPHPGSSFSHQVKELAWSAWAIAHMDYSGRVVIEDLNRLLFDEMDGKLLAETIHMLGW